MLIDTTTLLFDDNQRSETRFDRPNLNMILKNGTFLRPCYAFRDTGTYKRQATSTFKTIVRLVIN